MEWRHPTSGEIIRWDFWISEPDTTNNRMALRSVIEAFAGLSRKGHTFSVVFTSDSKYIVDGMNAWVAGWMARGWTRKAGPIENLALWQEAVAAVEAHEREWRWVKGHAGHPQNEYANHLATRAAAEQTSSGGLVPSAFDEWMAAQKGKAVARGTLDAFPSAEAFRPCPRLPASGGGSAGAGALRGSAAARP